MSVEVIAQQIDRAERLAQNGELAEAVAIYQRLLKQTALDLDDPVICQMRLKALDENGRLLHIMGEPKAALDSYEQYYMEAGTSEHAVRALIRIGEQYKFMGEHQRSLEAYNEALQLAEALNFTPGKAEAYGALGGLLEFLGRVEEALANLHKAYSLFKQLDDLFGQVQTLIRISYTRFNLGEMDKVITDLEQAMALARENKLFDRLLPILNNLGETYQMLFDMNKALIYHQEGLELALQLKARQYEGDLRRNIGLEMVYLDQVEEGMANLYEALRLAQETHDVVIELQCHYTLALAEAEHGDLTKARQHVENLQKLAQESDSRGPQADALYAAGVYYRQIGEPQVAEQYWQQAVFVAHETNRRQLLWQAHAALAQISQNPALAQVHRRIAAEVIEQIAFPIQDETLRQNFLQAPAVQALVEAND